MVFVDAKNPSADVDLNSLTLKAVNDGVVLGLSRAGLCVD